MLPSDPHKELSTQRWRLSVQGRVQGVGFRPFAFRLAQELGIAGWVQNTTEGLILEIEGPTEQLESCRQTLFNQPPAPAHITDLQTETLALEGDESFRIRESKSTSSGTALISPDLATCSDCLSEIFDPDNRRYFYPFTNCTQCGPRYSILHQMPYDRRATTMHAFRMCPECQREYDTPTDRRFHAQPNACPNCGPQLELWNDTGQVVASHHEALQQSVADLEEGFIVALKGLGGFQLLVDATNEKAVSELRERKKRPTKPLALMTRDMDQARNLCQVSELEENILQSSAAPILLMPARDDPGISISEQVAPDQANLGIMLPNTPLHHLLMHLMKKPVVATSGNLTDEPICIDSHEALSRLNGLADRFLIHDRDIARPVDDSVVRVIDSQPVLLRAARGYAPIAIGTIGDVTGQLAVGGQQKNTVALGVGRQVILSQHIGNLAGPLARDSFEKTIGDLSHLHQTEIHSVSCDAHPEYACTQYAQTHHVKPVLVQHHYAHLVSCLIDNNLNLEEDVLGICWDGTGWGPDGTVWGGEFLVGSAVRYTRVGCLKPFSIPGGEQAVMEPCRSALGLLHETYGEKAFDLKTNPAIQSFQPSQLPLLKKILENKLHCYQTSSMGRLFDGVAALLGLGQEVTFEGEAAMLLEKVAAAHSVSDSSRSLPYALKHHQAEGENNLAWLDWTPMVRCIVDEMARGAKVSELAHQFHNTLASMAVEMAGRAGLKKVLLTGGCFQNKHLTERVLDGLRKNAFNPYAHLRVPPNDGGLALGQLLVGKYQKSPLLKATGKGRFERAPQPDRYA